MAQRKKFITANHSKLAFTCHLFKQRTFGIVHEQKDIFPVSEIQIDLVNFK